MALQKAIGGGSLLQERVFVPGILPVYYRTFAWYRLADTKCHAI
jgi:hypothetical protein